MVEVPKSPTTEDRQSVPPQLPEEEVLLSPQEPSKKPTTPVQQEEHLRTVTPTPMLMPPNLARWQSPTPSFIHEDQAIEGGVKNARDDEEKQEEEVIQEEREVAQEIAEITR